MRDEPTAGDHALARKAAAKAARTGDSAEKLAERRNVSDHADAKDAAARTGNIGVGSDIAGGRYPAASMPGTVGGMTAIRGGCER